MGKLAGKEAALKAQADELNREKASALAAQEGNFAVELALKEAKSRKQAEELAEKERYWAGEKEALKSDFTARFRLFARDSN